LIAAQLKASNVVTDWTAVSIPIVKSVGLGGDWSSAVEREVTAQADRTFAGHAQYLPAEANS
jgi:hypothetical protein